MLSALRDDALSASGGGFALRLSLPWIRSLPVWCFTEVAVRIDGAEATDLQVQLGDRLVEPADLADEPGWWYVQDRVVLQGELPVQGGHDVEASFCLVIPYLPAGPDAPLVLPFHDERRLQTSTAEATVSRDVR